MHWKILNFIISVFLCIISLNVEAQKKIEKPKTDTVKVKLYNGFWLNFDLSSLGTTVLGINGIHSLEGNIQVDLKHKYMPVIELGMGGANTTNYDHARFSTFAPFGRIGIDFNLLKRSQNKAPMKNFFLAGLRLGMSRFDYKYTNITVQNPYWGGNEIIDFKNNPTLFKLWLEFTAGVKVYVYKNFYIGWNIRTKSLISKDKPDIIKAWYIPGYGRTTGSSWGFNYTLGYHF